MAEEDELLTITKAAEESGFTPRRLRQLAHDRVLPAKLYGKTWLVSRPALLRFLSEHQPKTGRPRGSRNRRPTPDAAGQGS